MSEDYLEQVTENLEFVGAIAALTAGASAKQQKVAREKRQNALYAFREHVKRIESLYSTRPAQAFYDTLMAEWKFNKCQFTSKEFKSVEWKDVYVQTVNDLKGLKNYGLHQIEESDRTAAQNLFRTDLSKMEASAERRLKKMLRQRNRNRIVFWIAFPFLAILLVVVVLLLLTLLDPSFGL